ncbi:MAG: thioredoxin domain-containing protein [Anaerolineae bacterium]|nr:thioredoxin domain-containing protein [Anaerolineae bacterium]
MSVKTRTTSPRSTASRPQNLYIIGGIIATAVVIALLVIIVSGNSGTAADPQRFAGIPQSRTADGGFVVGNPDAPITLVEFADYKCPACHEYKPTIEEFIDRFVVTGMAKFEYRTIMTAGGQLTGYAYQLAECTEEQRQGAFWESYEVLFEYGTRGGYDQQMARPLSERLNLNLSELLTCVPTAKQITTDQALAQQLGVTGTPTVFIRYGDGDPMPLPTGRDIDTLALLVETAQ